MNRDRGFKKWEMSIMLPEHVTLVRHWRREDDHIDKPELTEWDLQVVQEKLELSMKMKCETDIKVWGNGQFEIHRGIISKINHNNRHLFYSNPFGEKCGPIRLNDIIDISAVEFIEI
ncbi:YolD-like family protein [Viridibacillus sp. NPDC096237]|uniref:YolD-like family protein n=1 Tax=Viridibacillus sp. NPDC096237 TaxID=3390721 RepID=UPI003D06BDD1